MNEAIKFANLVEANKEDIFSRKEIKAPAGFVSVYHTIDPEFLPSVARDGLRQGVLSHYFPDGRMSMYIKRNEIVDTFRPQSIAVLGISRKNLYALPSLDDTWHSNSMRRFNPKPRRELEWEYDAFVDYSPEYLKSKGFKDKQDYVTKMSDPTFLKTLQTTEVLELKIDPEKAMVFDAQTYENAFEDIKENREASRKARAYWEDGVKLSDFVKYYKLAQRDDSGEDIKDKNGFKYPEDVYMAGTYYLKTGAPDNLPGSITKPEVLIPEDIPENYIKVI